MFRVSKISINPTVLKQKETSIDELLKLEKKELEKKIDEQYKKDFGTPEERRNAINNGNMDIHMTI